jgi:predicted acetyltransferase
VCSDRARESLLLQAPSADLQDSYRSLIAELEAGRERRVPFVLDYPFENFETLLARLRDDANGIDLPEGFVPHSTFWLVRNGKDIVGVSNLRHSLTPYLLREGGNIGYGIRPSARRNGYGREILRQTLPKARALGLSRVLVTCGKANLGSARIILDNGGVLESEENSVERGEVVQRYWIPTGT